jgi:hypothetical protein
MVSGRDREEKLRPRMDGSGLGKRGEPGPGSRRPGGGLPAECRHGPERAGDPLPTRERRQDGPTARDDYRHARAGTDRGAERVHRAPGRPPEERHDPRRLPREPARAGQQRLQAEARAFDDAPALGHEGAQGAIPVGRAPARLVRTRRRAAAAPPRQHLVTRLRSRHPPHALSLPVCPPTRGGRFSRTSPRIRPGPCRAGPRRAGLRPPW